MKTTELLANIDLFREMTPQDLAHLASRTEQLRFPRKKIIFNAGDRRVSVAIRSADYKRLVNPIIAKRN